MTDYIVEYYDKDDDRIHIVIVRQAKSRADALARATFADDSVIHATAYTKGEWTTRTRTANLRVL